MKIYFACSLRGQKKDNNNYEEIVSALEKYGEILSEHISRQGVKKSEMRFEDSYIYERDLKWLTSSDVLVAEVTMPSLGVGYKLAYAEKIGKPVICLFDTTAGSHLSVMVTGNKKLKIIRYGNRYELEKKLEIEMSSISPKL